MMKYPKKNKDTKCQLVPITLSNIILQALNGIIAYIAVYFFKPLWEKFMKWWKNEI